MCCTANPCADCSKLYETTTETNKIEFWEFSFQSLREMPAMGPVVKLSVVCCVPAVDLTHRWDNKRATWADIQMTMTQLPSYTTLSCRFALFVRSGDGQAQSEQNDIQNNNLFRSSSFPLSISSTWHNFTIPTNIEITLSNGAREKPEQKHNMRCAIECAR